MLPKLTFEDNDDDYDYPSRNDYQQPDNSENMARLMQALMGQYGQGRQQPTQAVSQMPQDRSSYYNRYQNQTSFPTKNLAQSGIKGSNSLMDLLLRRESGGNYKAQNSLGFLGGYQFGAPALESVGYLKKGAGRLGNKALNNPSNWTIPGGKEAYLANKQLQDRAFLQLAKLHENQLRRMGHINDKTDKKTVNAMIAAAHLSGPGGVKALLKGKNRKDAYGTGAKEYFNLGLKAKI